MIFIPSEKTNLEWAERYIRSSYKPKVLDAWQKNQYDFYLLELKKYNSIVIIQFGERKELSYEDSLKFLKCFTCDKEHINNSRRYCESCEYYSPNF